MLRDGSGGGDDDEKSTSRWGEDVSAPRTGLTLAYYFAVICPRAFRKKKFKTKERELKSVAPITWSRAKVDTICSIVYIISLPYC